MTKEIGFKITVIGSEEQLSAIAGIEKQLKSLNDQRKALNKTVKEGEALSETEARKLAEIKVQTAALTAQRRDALKAIELQTKAMNGETESAIQISARLALLRRDYDLLGKAEREAAEGTQLLDKITALDAEIKSIDGNSGRFQRNVGNYALALQNAGQNGDLLTKVLKQMKAELSGLDQSSSDFAELNNQIQSVEASINKLNGNVNRQTRQFNGLSNSINQISRELPAFTFSMQTGFLAISNNLPILSDEIGRLRAANLELAASGQPTVSVFKQIVSSIFSWQTAMSLMITVLTIFGPKLYELITGTKELTAAQKKAAEEAKGFSLQMIEQNKRADALLETQTKLNKQIERFNALAGDNNDYKDIGEVLGILSKGGDLATVSMRDLESALSNLKKVREDLSSGSTPLLFIDGESPESEARRREKSYNAEKKSLDDKIALLEASIEKRKPIDKKEGDRLKKEIEDLNNQLLSLIRQNNEAEIALFDDKLKREIASENERFRQQIEDLEAMKGKNIAINSEINEAIELAKLTNTKNLKKIEVDHQADMLKLEKAFADNQIEISNKEHQNSISNLDAEFDKRQLVARTSITDQTKLKEELYKLELAEIDAKIQVQKDYNQDSTKLELERLDIIKKYKEEASKDSAKIDEDELKQREENFTAISNSSIDAARTVASTISQIKRDALQRDLQRETDSIKAASDTELSILKNQLDKGFLSEAQFTKKKEDLDRKTAERTLEAQKKAFEEKKRLDTNAALMNGALAITSILAQYPKFDFGVAAAAAIVAAGITTAAQVATIQKQEFAESGLVMPEDLTNGRSGKVPNRQNIPTKSNGDNVLATVKVGEVFLNKRHQEMLGGDSTFAAIGVPGFAGSGKIGLAPRLNNTPPAPISFGGVTGGNYLTRDEMADLMDMQADRLAGIINGKQVTVLESDIRDSMARVDEYNNQSSF